MMTILTLATCVLGFACLALAMKRHYRQLTNRQLTNSELSSSACLWFRYLGTGSLILSFTLSVMQSGWPVGTVLWFGLATISILVVILTLSYYST